jgi:hypothetical protein
VDASNLEFRAFVFSWLIPAFRAIVAESACRETTKHRPRKRENTKLPKWARRSETDPLAAQKLIHLKA